MSIDEEKKVKMLYNVYRAARTICEDFSVGNLKETGKLTEYFRVASKLNQNYKYICVYFSFIIL